MNSRKGFAGLKSLTIFARSAYLKKASNGSSKRSFNGSDPSAALAGSLLSIGVSPASVLSSLSSEVVVSVLLNC